MVNQKLRKALNKYGEENDATYKLFDNPSFDNSIIGISHDYRIVYDYNKMVDEFAEENNCSLEEAEEFIQYNTMRALPYAGEGAPIVVEYDSEYLEEMYGDD